MPQTVREVMTEKPLALQEGTTLQEAARAMRDHDVGDVVLLRDDQVTGIVTDRDIVIRGVAEGLGPDEGVLSQVASKELVTASPDASLQEALELMRSRAADAGGWMAIDSAPDGGTTVRVVVVPADATGAELPALPAPPAAPPASVR